MSNTLGKLYRVTSFGESHGRCIGVVVDVCPAGHRVDLDHIQHELDRRRPNQSSVSTPRSEEDRLEVMSGVFNGVSTGAPICMLTWNTDTDSSKYDAVRWTPRPGHADYTAQVRYGGNQDYRGGGRFSGRVTAGYVMAGALAKQVLAETLGVEVLGYTSQVGSVEAPEATLEQIRESAEGNPVRCPDPESAAAMEREIHAARDAGDSVGGKVTCVVVNVPPGVGQPVFDTLDGDLAKALFSVPAVKAVEFGAGTALASMRGSQSNDAYYLSGDAVRTRTNNMGGVLGGLSSGAPLTCTVTVKATPSIAKQQSTVDLRKMKDAVIQVEGRHDPCVAPRAVPVVESVVAIILLDHLLQTGHVKQVLEASN
ncbi:chorismate synthase [Candidatus Bathyarchaeota archaeon]|nr:chorismate synthase [Candidatus Bathyarchaeota archaeon]